MLVTVKSSVTVQFQLTFCHAVQFCPFGSRVQDTIAQNALVPCIELQESGFGTADNSKDLGQLTMSGWDQLTIAMFGFSLNLV